MDSIVQGISPKRAVLLAQLAAERSKLLLHLEGLDESTLTTEPVIEDWTAAALLAHLAYWDAFAADRLGKLAGERLDEIRPLGGDDSLERRNAAMRDQFAGIGFTEAVALLQKERRNLLAALGQVNDEALSHRIKLRPDWRVMPRSWVSVVYRHDAEHAAHLARWRRAFPANDPSIRVIQRSLLRPLMGLSQQDFLALAALVPPDDREAALAAGGWSLKQAVGHLSDYERMGVQALKAVAAEREPAYELATNDFEAFNENRASVWAETSWSEAWATYLATRRALLLIAETLPEEALARPFVAPWSAMTTACGYLLDMAQHEREHAAILRRAFNLRALPRRLSHDS